MKSVWYGYVDGLTFCRYGEVAKHLTKGEELELRRQKDNPHDSKAVAVFYQEKQVGWVPKAYNEPVARLMDQGCNLRTFVVDHSVNSDYTRRLKVDIINYSATNQKDTDIMANINTGASVGNTTTVLGNIGRTNLSAAKSAAFLEAGRIANKEVTKLAAKVLPIMVRGYADTPFGRLLTANVAVMAAAHFRPEDDKLQQLVEAMQVQAYQELLQTLEIDEFLESLLESPKIKTALGKLKKTEQE